MIQLKTPAQMDRMRGAGLVVADALGAVRAAVEVGVTPLDLDAVAADVIRRAGATPSFLGYHGYPATICASVNDVVVHGIPNARPLRAGDVISVDCGAVLDGWHGDSATTIAVGEVPAQVAALVAACESALWAGIAAFAEGGRLRNIGSAVQDRVETCAATDRLAYGIVEDYTGHGIGTEMHQDPEVHNVRVRAGGTRLRPGLVLAIEPMLTLGTAETDLDEDGWTVRTADGSWAAHAEHTVALTARGPWVLTAHDGGAAALARLGVRTPALAAGSTGGAR